MKLGAVAALLALALLSIVSPARADEPQVLILRNPEPTALCRAIAGELSSLGMRAQTGAIEEAWPELVEGALQRDEIAAVVVCTSADDRLEVFYRRGGSVVSEAIGQEGTIHGRAVAVAELLHARLLPPAPPGEEPPEQPVEPDVEEPTEPSPPDPPPRDEPRTAPATRAETELSRPEPGVEEARRDERATPQDSEQPPTRNDSGDSGSSFPSRWWAAAGAELGLADSALQPGFSVLGRFGVDLDRFELGLGFAYQLSGPTVNTIDVDLDATALRIEARAAYRFDVSDRFAVAFDAELWVLRLVADLFRVTLPLFDEGSDEAWAFGVAAGAEARLRLVSTLELFVHASAAALVPRIVVQLPGRDFAPPLAELGHFVAILDAGARVSWGQ